MCVQTYAVFLCGFWEGDEYLQCDRGLDCVSTLHVRESKLEDCRLCKEIKDTQTVISIKARQIEEWTALEGQYDYIVEELEMEIEDLNDSIAALEAEHEDRKGEPLPS